MKKRLSFMLLLGGLSIMSCKSTEDAVNTNGVKDSVDNVESIVIEKSGQEEGGRVAISNTANAKQSVRDLVGDWVWVKTSCCGRMTGETFPNETDPQRIISFDDKGNASYFTDETKEKVSSIPFKIGSLGQNQATVKIGELQPAIFIVENNTLVLSWGYIDLQMEYYERIK